MMGQRSDQQSLEMIRNELGLNKPKGMQYIKYLNDLSPLSFYNTKDSASYFYLNPHNYRHYQKLFQAGATAMVLKYPYLRRSYQSNRIVNDIIAETLPNTFVLAWSP